MKFGLYLIEFAIIFTVMTLARKSITGKNSESESKSVFYNMTAEEAERKYTMDRWIFYRIPMIGAILFFVFVIAFMFIFQDTHPNIFLLLGMLAVLLTLSVLCTIGLYKNKNVNSVIERDCDIVKGRKMMELRSNDKTRTKKARATFICEIAHCYALSNDPDWAMKSITKLREAEALCPAVMNSISQMNVRLKLAYRQGNMKELDYIVNAVENSSMLSLGDYRYKAFLEEAKIHRHMALGDYAIVRSLIDKHFQTGDVPLAYVYMHYYMAVIELSEGNEVRARSHIQYIINNGGNTYYLNDLKEKFDI